MVRLPFDPATDYFGVLGLVPGATDAQVRAAYRRLAKTFHPDLHAGSSRAQARMARLNAAKAVLLSPSTRTAYEAARRARYGSAVALATPPAPSVPAAAVARPAGRAAGVASVRRPAAARRATVLGGPDRHSAFLLAAVVPLVGALAVYLVQAIQIAGQPARRVSPDLALAPITRASPEAVARSMLAMVQGKPPNRHAGLAAWNASDLLKDASPESSVVRALGRRLYFAGRDGDVGAWSLALADLCRMAGECTTERPG